MTYANITRPFNTPLSHRLAALTAALHAARAKRATYRQTVRELNALSTRELHDLGIDPMMIKAIAHEAAYGKRA